MAKPRKERLTRKASGVEPAAPVAATATLETPWTREPRPLTPPLKAGREWARVRRIAYL